MQKQEQPSNKTEREKKIKEIKRQRKQLKSMELMGVSDIAEFMGCSKAKVSNLNKRNRFIDPAAVIGGRPVWLKSELIYYLERKQEDGKNRPGNH